MTGKKEFEIFDKWASTYDKSIRIAEKNNDWLYKDYTNILLAIREEVRERLTPRKNTLILDIGSGTGNLIFLMVSAGYKTIGVEPSPKMREEIMKKSQNISVVPGTFLSLPFENNSVDGIVSSYAWHHLSSKEKLKSIGEMRRVLKKNGIIVIADLMFLNPAEKKKTIGVLKSKNLQDVIEDIESEAYGYVNSLFRKFTDLGFKIKSKQLTELVWLLGATPSA
ncbi:MAG: class I SAM-dependent methyltransferase [bacterium]|nr:class I SAM-dependent methyltransferase [bacterium]